MKKMAMWHRILTIMLAYTLASACMARAENWNVELVGRTPGFARDVYILGNYAYLCAGSALVVLDISDPSNPTEVGQGSVPSVALGVHVSDGYAYVADGRSGLRVIDISNPADPQEVGFYDTPASAHDVHVSGGYSYVADGSSGLRVIDISNPANPQEVGYYGASAGGVQVSDGYAYYVSFGGHAFLVVDISNPANPQQVGRLDDAQNLRIRRGVHVSGGYAYTVGYFGLSVIDISNPADPQEVGYYDTQGPNSPMKGWDARNVHVSGGYAYVAGARSGLRVIDISDPSNPQEVGGYDAPGYAVGVQVSGDYAYVADGGGGLRVIDISNPADPRGVGFYGTIGDAGDVHVSGGYAYVADYDGLKVIDIFNPANPQVVGDYDTPGYAREVHVSGGYAYVADGGAGLRVIDISNPADPQEVGGFPGPVLDVHVSGGYAYVVSGSYGFRVIDISDPANPQTVGIYRTLTPNRSPVPFYAHAVHVSGGYAYVADRGYDSYPYTMGGLRVIDISDPSNPHEVGLYKTPGMTLGVYVSGSYAYVADSWSGLRVIDISDPSNPQEVGLYKTPGLRAGVGIVIRTRQLGIHVSGDYAYVADYADVDGEVGLRVIDISNPADPQEVGFYETSEFEYSSWGVHVSDGYAYMADGSRGLLILRYTGVSHVTQTSVTIVLQPKAMSYMGELSVSGQLATTSVDPVDHGGLTIEVILTDPAGTTQAFEATTEADGNYRLAEPFVPRVVGEWQVTAKFAGRDRLEPCEGTGSFTVAKRPAQIVFDTVATGEFGDDMEVIGRLEPALKGELISLEIRLPDKTSTHADITTEAAGVFRYSLKLGMLGTWEVTSNWHGNEEYEGAKADLAISVEPAAVTNSPPVIADIPDQTVDEGVTFTPIKLDDFTSDPDNTDAEMKWTVTGSTDLSVAVDNDRAVTITVTDLEWNGSETITFTATDPDGLSASDTVTFTVIPVNDPPVVSDIPDQTIEEGGVFAAISLDEHVSDVDNVDSEITWVFMGNTNLTIAIDDAHDATITVSDLEWSGSEVIMFTATDPAALSASDSVTFTVTPVNDPPVISDIPDQAIEESNIFAGIPLDDYVSDPDNADTEIAWTYSGNAELLVTISDDHIATISVPDPEWSGNETIVLTATDPGGLNSSDSATFTVKPMAVLPGDANNDGQVRSNDAVLALQFAAGLMEPTRYQKRAADMNGDGKIGANDALLILIAAAGSAAPGESYVASAGGPVTVTMDEAHGVAGDRITIPVKIDNVLGLAGGDIHIVYNSTVLRAVGASSESGVLLASNIAESGMIRIAFAGSESLNSRKLAEIQFDVLADDVSPLKFQRVDLYQPNALPIDSRPVDSEFRSWAIPAEHGALLQNFPNPSNPETWIPYQLKVGGEVTIRIYSAAGDPVRELNLEYMSAGIYVSRDRAAYWDGKNEAGEQVSSGVYFYTIQAGNFTATKKMAILE